MVNSKRSIFNFLFIIISIFLISILSCPFNTYAESLEEIQLNTSGNYSYVSFYNDQIFISDQKSDSVLIYNAQDKSLITTITGKELDDGKLINPSLTTAHANTLYIYCSIEDEINKIYAYDLKTYQKIDCFRTFNQNNNSYSLETITSITTNSVGDIFCIAKYQTDYLLLKKDNNSNIFETKTIQETTIDENSKIVVSYSEQYVYIVNTNNITKLDANTLTVSNTYNISESVVSNVKIDKDDNIYIYNNSTHKLNQYKSTEDFSTQHNIEHVITNEVTCFDLDIINGNLFILDTTSSKVYIENQTDVIANISDFTKPNVLNKSLLSTQIEIAKLNKNAIAYNFPYTISPNRIINEGTFVFVLEKTNNFYLCLITNQEEYNLFVYINNENLSTQPLNNTNENIKISSIVAPVYKYPSSLKAENGSQETIKSDLTVSSGDTLLATRLIVSPADFNNKTFYEVDLKNGTFGYIDSSSAFITTTEEEKEESTATLQTNAYLLGDGSNKIELFNLEGNDFVSTQIYLDNETRIKVDKETFDVNTPYTQIKFLSEDNKTISIAYVKTNSIRFDGVRIEIIIATILCTLCVLLGTVLIIYIKKNKSKMH